MRDKEKFLVLIGVMTLVLGLMLNIWAAQKIANLSNIVDECNEHFQKQFDEVCVPQAAYGFGWQALNWTLNLTIKGEGARGLFE